MNKETYFDQIEAWLSGELPEAAARALEAEMASNPALAAQVEQHRLARLAIDTLQEQEIQKDIQHWRSTLDEIPAPPSEPSNTRWIWIIFFFCLLTGGIWYIRRPNASDNAQEPSKQIPFAEKDPIVPPKENVDDGTHPTVPTPPEKSSPVSPAKHQQYAGLAMEQLASMRSDIIRQYGQTMGDEDEMNLDFKIGLTAYKNNEPQQAELALLKIPKESEFFIPAQEMLAELYFRRKNYAAAAHCYELFASQNSGAQIDWRLVQFYLADFEHHERALRTKLDTIIDSKQKHLHREEAVKLKSLLK